MKKKRSILVIVITVLLCLLPLGSIFASELPDKEGLEDFLYHYTYPWGGEFYAETDQTKHSENEAGFLLQKLMWNIQCVNYSQYPGEEERTEYTSYISSHNTGNQVEWVSDPRGWSEQLKFYYKYDAEKINWIAKNIFNCSDESIEQMVANGETNKRFYRDGDYYYYMSGGIGWESTTTISINSFEKLGKYYYVEFNDHTEVMGGDVYDTTCYAKLKYKKVDGKRYWSLYQYSKKPISKEDVGAFATFLDDAEQWISDNVIKSIAILTGVTIFVVIVIVLVCRAKKTKKRKASVNQQSMAEKMTKPIDDRQNNNAKMFCSYCGSELDETVKFCPKCGHRIL